MLVLRQIGAEVAPRGVVIKADDYAAVVEARAVVEAATRERDRILAEAREEYARQKEAGYAAGFERGKAEMAEQVVATVSQSAQYLAQLEGTLVDVVMKALRRILGECDERERTERVVRTALELLRQQHQVRIKLPPAQLELLRDRLSALQAAFPRIHSLEVMADPRLPADGCVLETELGVIDASLETQLRAIEKALIRNVR